jgi:uncharacterized protein
VTLRPLDPPLAICRLDAAAEVPPWTLAGPFASITRTADELSIVCAQDLVPPEVRAERGWRALGIAGPLDFAMTGVLAALAGPLAAEGISLFAISTFDTDYVLVREADLGRAIVALRRAGHVVEDRPDHREAAK